MTSFELFEILKGEFQICPRMDLDNILYVEYLRYIVFPLGPFSMALRHALFLEHHALFLCAMPFF